MVAPATVPGILQSGLHADRPLPDEVSVGSLYACEDHPYIYSSDGAAWATWHASALVGTSGGVSFVIDGAGSAITTGSKGLIELPFAGEITAGRLFANASGSIVVDIKKATYAGLPTMASICASAKLTLASAQKVEDETLTGWTIAISTGDWIEFVVDSATTVSRVTVSLTIQRI